MGQVNQESNLVGRVVRLEAFAEQIRKLAGNTSSIISRGGLSLINDSFLKIVDSDGKQRLFMGKQSYGGGDQTIFVLRDQNEAVRFGLFDFNMLDGYSPAVIIYDQLGHITYSTDSNGGMAEPWVPVVLYPKTWPSTFLDTTGTDNTLPVSACNGNSVWEGRIGKVSHPRIQLDFIGGRVTGTTGSPTYTFVVNGVTLDTWSQTAYAGQIRGPFDISSLLTQQNIIVQVKVTATGTGTDRIAAQPNACYLRQT